MLTGRTVVVTGGARGVGREIAQACVRHGARIVIGDLRVEEGEAAAAALRAEGATARFLSVDIADPQSVAEFAKDIAQSDGEVHGLVNNAAIATDVGGAAFEDIDIDLWDRVMRTNVRGTWLVTRALSPGLRAGARIVNMASDTALWGPERLLAYVASKGAVIAMTRSLARELGPRGIGVVAVAPGLMRNEATQYVPVERHRTYEAGRAVPGPMEPKDMTEIVAFLLSEHALPLTGQVINTGAGFVMH